MEAHRLNLFSTFFRGRAIAPRRRWRVTGPFKGITGNDRLVRSIVPELRKRGVEVELSDLPQWSPTRRFEKLPRHLRKGRRLRTADLHLHFGMPPQVVCSPDCPNLNYTMFEADRIPPDWASATEMIDLVVVPTESSRSSFVTGGVPMNKVAVCPEGADFEQFSAGLEPLELRTRDGRAVRDFRCRFLNVAEFITRKNLAGLLRVWLRETRATDEAVLILKTGFYKADSRRHYEDMVRMLEDEMGRRLEDAAPMLLCERQLDEAEMPRLYASASHYWSMSFGEGFDLPMMEAAACDLQLIAPCHSSYLHYLKPEHAFLLPVESIDPQIPDDPGLAAFFQGSKWWRPDESAAAETIRAIMSDAVAPRQSARQCLMDDCSWRQMADRLIRLVDEHHERLHGQGRTN